MTDAVIGEWQARIRSAAAAKSPLRLRGGGSKDFYGGAPVGDMLDTRACAGIVDYDPTELVITARAGTPLAEIEDTLRTAGQMLAFEPPHFGAGEGAAATFGGCIAAGLSGPRRPHGGAARDLVLGVRVLDGKGDDLTFGGRVMKNVAGFDVPRLMTGALGTLGVLVEISVKCQPCPKLETTRVFECSAVDDIRLSNEWARQPLPISATCHHAGLLSVRLSGAAPAVKAALASLGGEPLVDAEAGDAFWRGVRDHTHPYFAAAIAAGTPLWRLSVKSTAPHADVDGEQLIEWGGALRWLHGGAGTDPARLRAWAQQHGGHAMLFRAGAATADPFHPMSATMTALHGRLKAVFDPAGIFNRGRLHPSF